MRQRKREITGRPEDFRKMDRTMATATKLVEDYLDRPYRDMIKTGCSDVEVACAFISLAYFILRQQRSSENAADTFDILAQLDRRRHEARRARGISATDRRKLH